MTAPGPRPWDSAQSQEYVQRWLVTYSEADLAALDDELHTRVEAQEQVMRESIVLYAGTNTPNPRLARLLGSPVGSRPHLGPPGDSYNRGMDDGSRIGVLTAMLMSRLLAATYVETRVPSGSVANLYAYLATTRPGDRVLAFSDAAAGHPTHHAVGAAGLAGLEVHETAFDPTRMDVDLAGLAEQCDRLRPRLLVVAGSMCLFPYDVAGVRAVADEVGATVLYDAAHMGGLIAGGRFQQPLAEGAHLMTGSTYKSFGGPPSGFVATNDPDLAERLDRIAFPGLTANHDLARTAALGMAALDLLEHGPAYADACIATGQALAAALRERDVSVFEVPGRGFTASQHVAVAAHEYGGGDTAARTLEPAGLLTSSIGLPLPPMPDGQGNALRLGTQEVVRWGMTPSDMPAVADLVGRVLVDGEPAEHVRPDARALRAAFDTLHFVRR